MKILIKHSSEASMATTRCSPGKKISLVIPLAPDCCRGEGRNTSTAGALCPLCRREGMHVKNITVRHILSKEMEEKAGQEDYCLCMNERCDIAYYNNMTGIIFEKKDIDVPLWFKDDANPRYACYCSRITYEDVIRAVKEQKIADMAAIRNFYDPDAKSQCKIKNPTGKCCSPVFREIIEKAMNPEESR